MYDIRLKKIVDEKNIDLKQLSSETLIPYGTLKEWYDTGQFDGDQVEIHQLTNVTAALGVEITELIDLPSSCDCQFELSHFRRLKLSHLVFFWRLRLSHSKSLMFAFIENTFFVFHPITIT